MKPSNNKEQQKILLVVALAVAMVAVVGYNLFGTQGSAAPAAPAPSGSPSPGAAAAATASSSATPGGPASPGAPTKASIIDFSTIPMVTSGRDPFVPNGPAAATNQPAPTPSRPPSIYIPQVPQKGEIGKGLAGAMRLGNPGGAADDAGGGSGFPSAPKQEPVRLPDPVPPAYVVTGVVLGDKGGRDVAILRGGASGQDERKFVTVGEDVGNGFYVAAIQANGIVLKSRAKATLNPVNLTLGRSE
jgi:hypothetical protein